MERRLWNVYLSGEIHTDWRSQVERAARERELPVRLVGPELDHATSDGCGEKILGPEADSFWRDHKSAKINSIRNHGLMQSCDIVVVRFGDKYRQWNAAFDAGQAAASGKSLITLHDPSLDHALKEVDAAALATARTVEQVVEVLAYVTRSLS
jgi:YtoQ family protein